MKFKKGELTNESFKVIMRDIELMKSYRLDEEDFNYYYDLVVGNLNDIWGVEVVKMRIEFKARNKRIAKAYFIEDFEEKDGEEKLFYMVITPIEEEFYYLREDKEGIFIMGEAWIINNKADALEFVKKKRAEIEDIKKLKFVKINKEGELI